jgi:hypothetical protein
MGTGTGVEQYLFYTIHMESNLYLYPNSFPIDKKHLY